MGLKESLRKLQEQEQLDKKLSLKREVNKELTKLKREKISEKRCIECGKEAKYSIKGSNDWYCKECAVEYFGDVKNLKKMNIDSGKKTGTPPGLFFITGSDNKFREVSQILPGIQQLKLDLDEIQEIDAKKIIEHKLLEAKKVHKGDASFMVEDTSLYLDCMKGLPGPLIKWFLHTIGNEGLYELTVRFKNNKAEARTLIGYYSKGKIRYFQGIVKGRITSPGQTDFGWDAIFIPEGYEKRFCEMHSEDKNKISMRGQAVRKLKEYLNL